MLKYFFLLILFFGTTFAFSQSYAYIDSDYILSKVPEYTQAKEVTKKRMYLETMEQILSGMNKIIIDGDAGQGVVPYLPLPELDSRRNGSNNNE